MPDLSLQIDTNDVFFTTNVDKRTLDLAVDKSETEFVVRPRILFAKVVKQVPNMGPRGQSNYNNHCRWGATNLKAINTKT